MEKNQLLFGENINFYSKNGRFLLKKYRRTRKKVVFFMKKRSKYMTKVDKINKKLV